MFGSGRVNYYTYSGRKSATSCSTVAGTSPKSSHLSCVNCLSTLVISSHESSRFFPWTIPRMSFVEMNSTNVRIKHVFCLSVCLSVSKMAYMWSNGSTLALTRNPEVPRFTPKAASHTGVNCHMASLLVCQLEFSTLMIYCNGELS